MCSLVLPIATVRGFCVVRRNVRGCSQQDFSRHPLAGTRLFSHSGKVVGKLLGAILSCNLRMHFLARTAVRAAMLPLSLLTALPVLLHILYIAVRRPSLLFKRVERTCAWR